MIVAYKFIKLTSSDKEIICREIFKPICEEKIKKIIIKTKTSTRRKTEK